MKILRAELPKLYKVGKSKKEQTPKLNTAERGIQPKNGSKAEAYQPSLN